MPLTEEGKKKRLEYMREWRAKNKERLQEYYREYYRKVDGKTKKKLRDMRYWNKLAETSTQADTASDTDENVTA